MQVETGKIYEGAKDDLAKRFGGRFVEIDPDDMTGKQKDERQVSLHDHRSKLGVRLTEMRSTVGLTKNQRRNLRRRLKRSTKGRRNPNSKLTEEEVRGIRQGLRAGVAKKMLARLYGCDPECIRKINRGDTWRWLS